MTLETTDGAERRDDGSGCSGGEPRGTDVGPEVTRPRNRPVRAALGELIAAGIVAAVVAGVGIEAVRRTHFPAFTTSNMERALTTVAQIVALLVIAGGVTALRRRRSSRWGRVLSWAGLSAFATATLAIPLASTRLYLFGVSVDQEFRTQFLTRTAATPGLPDMNYADLPSYYPSGWFWIGGRLADALSMPGWEMYKPYAIGSLAVAVVVAAALWSRLVRPDVAIMVATAQAAIVLAYGSPESYGAIVAVLVPPVMVLAWSGLTAAARRGLPGGPGIPPPDVGTAAARSPLLGSGGWGAVVGTGIFLGVSACMYTLYTGFAAGAVVLMAVAAAVAALHRTARADGRAFFARGSLAPIRLLRAGASPLARLAVIAVIAGAIALVVWAPYLLDRLRNGGGQATATDYLPTSGSILPLPMFDWSLLGALTLGGLLWIVVRFRASTRAQALGLAVAALYLWVLASMAFTVLGTTLLGFRLEPVLLLLLGAAGVFCVVDVARWAVRRAEADERPGQGRRVQGRRVQGRRARLVITTLGVLAAIMFAQNIPDVLHNEIAIAYSDTDGYGHRADGYPPGAAQYFSRIDDTITAQTGTDPADTVILSTDFTFLSYYPYLGFQALTSHYANPLGDFAARNDAIERWTQAPDPAAFLDEMDSAPWRPPQAFILRRAADGDGYTLRMSSDVYPNDPNVKIFTVEFPAKLFDDPAFTATDIGPFTVFVRT